MAKREKTKKPSASQGNDSQNTSSPAKPDILRKKKPNPEAEHVFVEAESQAEAAVPVEALEPARSSKSPRPKEAANGGPTLMERCKLVWDAFMPLVDRLPRDMVIADESLAQPLTNPVFLAYCDEKELDENKVKRMANSELIRHLQDGLYSSTASSGKHAASFKRPLSPPRTPSGTKEATNPPGKKKSADKKHASSAENGMNQELVGRLQAKQRLQDKLQAFKAKRKALLTPEESHEASVLRSKLRKLKKKEKTREKKSHKKGPKDGDNAPGSATPSSQRSSSIVSEEGRMIFSRFDFFNNNDDTVHPKQHKGKNLTHLLNKAQADQRKLQAAEADDGEKGQALRQKKAWQEALLKAQGVKLKNDPDKLKKALKEQTKRKKRSERKWQERIGHVHKEKKERQDKRQKNLDKRKETKVNKKKQRAIKKGHLIPGFN